MTRPHAKRFVDAVFFIPFAERELDAVLDTVDSIERYVVEPHHVYAVDDCSPSHLDERLHALRPAVTVLRNDRNRGPRAGLHETMIGACRQALADFDFRVFVKMDSDALMTGPGLVTAAARYFAAHPAAGVLGSCRIRADGHRRRWMKWRLGLWYESTRLRTWFGRRARWQAELRQAAQHGYRRGEHVLGGAYVVSAACVRSVVESSMTRTVVGSVIAEDVIWSLLARAAGYEIHDFGMPRQPMALALDRVPIPKEEVIRQHKAIVHSIRRGFDGESEAELRAFFRRVRLDAVR